jgi:bifunctional UDP-N-acetylglucosamine pyrophosphorylase / glucosamine-1-phosphate N-acetyltransferase
MCSSTPKMLHRVCGRPMVLWPVMAATGAGVGQVAVVASPETDLSEVLPDSVEIVVQERADGTGGAVRAAGDLVAGCDEVLVLCGDVPLVSAAVITDFLDAHRESGAAATVMTTVLDDPGSYGRIIRDREGGIERIVEAKAGGDATADELAVTEINSGVYAFAAGALLDALAGLSDDNAQGELYLTDAIAGLRSAGHAVGGWTADDPAVNMGINDLEQLSLVEAEARRRIASRHMLAGVSIADPGSTWIDADVTIGRDARIEPGSSLQGATEIGEGAVVGPHSTVIDSGIGSRSAVVHSYLNLCEVMEDCSVGPFAYLRPGAALSDGAKAGTFVELKNTTVGAGAKVPHLSYVGDSDVGSGANLGAGTITANYDGVRKHRTVIGPGARVGVGTMLVAPVEVGENAWTGAGAVIREDVPPGSLAVTGESQRTIDDYNERRASEDVKKESDR